MVSLSNLTTHFLYLGKHLTSHRFSCWCVSKFVHYKLFLFKISCTTFRFVGFLHLKGSWQNTLFITSRHCRHCRLDSILLIMSFYLHESQFASLPDKQTYREVYRVAVSLIRHTFFYSFFLAIIARHV